MKVRVIGSQGRMGQIHCETYKSLGLEIVESGEDIVSIASPDQTHGGYVIQSLEEQKHVFVEKPLCTSTEELYRIKSLCVAHPKLHIGQNFPLRYRIKRLNVGNIYRLDASYYWGRAEKLGRDWRVGDYSFVMGGLIHMADLAIFLIGDLTLQDCEAVTTNRFKIPDVITALCRSKKSIVTLNFDGTTGPKKHSHHVLFCGTSHVRSIVNFEPTDKTQAIKDFVNNLDKPPENDFRATKLCLEIDECIASTSPGL